MQLKSMSESDYERFLARAIDDFAEDQVRAGAWQTGEAKTLAEQMFAARLSEGLASPNQYLLMITLEDSGEKVGELWWGIEEHAGNRFAALNDFVIYTAYRRRGLGQAALLAMEKLVHQEGLTTILLHVFGHNEAAWTLYRKMGYVERNVTMKKEL